MKLTTEGLTLGTIENLRAKGYSVVIDEDGMYADVQREAPLSHSVSVPEGESWGSLGEPIG